MVPLALVRVGAYYSLEQLLVKRHASLLSLRCYHLRALQVARAPFSCKLTYVRDTACAAASKHSVDGVVFA